MCCSPGNPCDVDTTPQGELGHAFPHAADAGSHTLHQVSTNPTWPAIIITGCRKHRPTLLHYCLLAAASLAFLLPWQFSQFVLVTQSFSLLILHALRLVPAATLSRLFLSMAAALTWNIVLQFCNSLLLFSLLPSTLLSCLVSSCLASPLPFLSCLR